VQHFIKNHATIDPGIIRTFTADDVRPRVTRIGDHLLLVLRGVNLNAGDEIDDMVSLLIWAGPGLVVTLRRRPVRTVSQMRDALDKGIGPADEGAFLVGLIEGLLDNVAPVVEEVEDRVDDLEDRDLGGSLSESRIELAEIRRRAISLRRYLAPQRDAMLHLMGHSLPWIAEDDRSHLREFADRTIHYVEDLDAVRERAAVIHEEIATRLSERMNRTMYVLTIVATILLPASLIAGLMGMNVTVPGQSDAWSFAIIIGLIVALAGVELLILRWMRLI
jgi:zinc transporter